MHSSVVVALLFVLGQEGGPGKGVEPGVDLDAVCLKAVPREVASCLESLRKVEQALAQEEVEAALVALEGLNNQWDLFSNAAGQCFGSLVGCACTAPEWRALKRRTVYTNAGALLPRWQGIGPIVERADALRGDAVSKDYAAARAALAGSDLERAAKAKLAGDLLGGEDPALQASLQKSYFAEEAKQVSASEPAFVDGQTRWYKTGIYVKTIRPVPNACTRLFGPDVALRYRPGSQGLSTMECRSEEQRVLTGDEIAEARSRLEAAEKMPPTNRPKSDAIWTEVVSVGSISCRAGTTSFKETQAHDFETCRQLTSFGSFEERWAHCVKHPPTVRHGCRTILARDTFCPGGQGNFNAGECLAASCPPGLDSLVEVSKGRLAEGRLDDRCFHCPVGVLDVDQTLAAHAQAAQRNTDDMNALYCRVGKAKPPKGHRK